MGSKYGLPKGVRIVWGKGEKPSGPFASFYERSSWEARLRVETESAVDGKLLLFVARADKKTALGEPPGWCGWACFALGPNRRFKLRYPDPDRAKEALDKWLVAHPEHWQQFVGEKK